MIKSFVKSQASAHNPRWRRFGAILVLISLIVSIDGRLYGANSDAGAETGQLQFENASGAASTSIVGSDSRLQLIVRHVDPSGAEMDWTRHVQFSAFPPSAISIDQTGWVTPLHDGPVNVTATSQNGLTANVDLMVTGTKETQPVSFVRQVIPLFTKMGCNGGGCHGKIAGQNGFRLSLLGFEPREDYKRLVAESRSRRISIASPDRSLLLQKTINTVPHGGGARTSINTHEYRVLRSWIAQGMPFGAEGEPTIQSIRVYPASRRMKAGSGQQLSVIAVYDDGHEEDVTRAAVFESNDEQMANVDATGWVNVNDFAGDVSVMARYQGHVAIFQSDIPMRYDFTGTTEWPSENIVDIHVGNKLTSLGIPPSDRCNDATFLRRATLDIAGRIPTSVEAEAFLSDTSAERYRRLIDGLLESEDYAAFFARKWGVILRNQRTDSALQVQNVLFHDWLQQVFRENRPYDSFVRELMTASGAMYSNPAVVWLNQVPTQNERVEDASQLFLGQRIQCARCHHHPYEKWSQEDYARMSAFFSTVSKKQTASGPGYFSRDAKATVPHPKTGKAVSPAGLGSETLSIGESTDPRELLSDWMTAPENPFFAKVLVNRYWKHFLGRGLVEPEDDLRVSNPPSNPELMDALADSFVESGYDLHQLVRTICLSRTYAASSQATGDNLGDRRSYSRFYPKRLTAEALLDAIDSVAGTTTEFDQMPVGTRAIELPDTGFDSYFLNVFGQPQSKTACECERSAEANLAQSLHLLNSEQMQEKLMDADGRAAELANDKNRTIEMRVREVYTIALSREPSQNEIAAAANYIDGRDNQREPWEDLIWALVNSKEFLFNH